MTSCIAIVSIIYRDLLGDNITRTFARVLWGNNIDNISFISESGRGIPKLVRLKFYFVFLRAIQINLTMGEVNETKRRN